MSTSRREFLVTSSAAMLGAATPANAQTLTAADKQDPAGPTPGSPAGVRHGPSSRTRGFAGNIRRSRETCAGPDDRARTARRPHRIGVTAWRRCMNAARDRSKLNSDPRSYRTRSGIRSFLGTREFPSAIASCAATPKRDSCRRMMPTSLSRPYGSSPSGYSRESFLRSV